MDFIHDSLLVFQRTQGSIPVSQDFSQIPAADHRIAVSPSQAARLLGLGRTKLYEAISSGELPSFKVGSRRLIRISEIEAWMQRLEVKSCTTLAGEAG